MKITIEIDADALVHAAWMARVERSERQRYAMGRFTSVPDAALNEIIAAAGRWVDSVFARRRADRAIDEIIDRDRERDRAIESQIAADRTRADGADA